MAFTCNRKSLKKSYQFLKYARAYLRKGRYAPGWNRGEIHLIYAANFKKSGTTKIQNKLGPIQTPNFSWAEPNTLN